VDFLIGGRESKLFTELAYHGLKNVAIPAIVSLFCAGFEIGEEL
jgi:hypothetical protein